MSLVPHSRTLVGLGVAVLGLVSTGAAAPASALGPTQAAPAVGVSSAARTVGTVHKVSPRGDDRGPGSVSRPWRTLARAAQARYGPGDVLLVQRGATYAGGLVLTSSGTAARPIRVLPTGAGTAPVVQHGDCVRMKGNYIHVSGLHVRGCSWSGVSLEGTGDALTRSRVSGNVVGVHVTPSARGGVVRSNILIDNRRLSPGKNGSNDDSGVNGVAVQGVGTVIAYNRFSGHHAPSPDYGTEGAAIEVYGARSTDIVANSSRNDSTFVELGAAGTNNTVIRRNTVISSVPNGYFVVTRGGGDRTFGPVLRTVVNHNSVAMNGARDGGLICYGGCSPTVLSASHNIIVARVNPTWSDGRGMGGGHNIVVNDSDPRSARPLFVDRTRNLRLVPRSPAVDTAGRCASSLNPIRPDRALGSSSTRCTDGNHDGRRGIDVGALER